MMKDLAKRLGVEGYPDTLEEIYALVTEPDLSICDEVFLRELNREFSLFGEFERDVLFGARDLLGKPDELLWATLAVKYIAGCDCAAKANQMTFPPLDGSPARDTLMLLVLLRYLPRCAELYRNRGFVDAELNYQLKTVPECLSIVNKIEGRPGITLVYYHWICLYIFCEIFNYGAFNYQIRRLELPHLVLKNKKSGEYAVLAIGGKYHRSGGVFGSLGLTDTDGAFEATFTETDECYEGYPTRDGVVVNESAVFLKSEWETVATPDSYVLSIHIPRGTRLDSDFVKAEFDFGYKLAKERFSDYQIDVIYCGTWLLSTALDAMLDGNSKILGFSKLFERFPLLCPNNSFFTFVFGKYTDDIASLPEDTSLQRKIKNLYLDGGYMHPCAGIYKYK